MYKSFAFLLVFLLAPSLTRAQAPPKVLKLEPAHMSVDVDAKTLKKIAVTFDQPMSTAGFSFCGGGPKFPKIVGKPRWKNNRTCVLNVDLEPDHEYFIFLNCPAGGNFRGTRGVKAEPARWSFTTLPKELPDPAKQLTSDKKALVQLKNILASRYSYFDLHDLDWDRIYKESTPKSSRARQARPGRSR